MLSALVKQGTTLHLSPGGGGERDRRNFEGMGITYFSGGEGGITTTGSPEGGSCKLWANYPCDWLLL